MSFLASDSLKERLPKILGAKYDEQNIKYGAYELHLGSEVFVTTDKLKKKLVENDQVEIPAGQFALLLTDESLTMPDDLIAFISIKFGEKFRGLINISGFHVDPGFRGRLKFSVYNAGSQPVILSRGKSLFQIWFASLDKKEKEPYTGKHKDQEWVSDEDVMELRGDIASPAVLKSELEKLRTEVETHLRVLDNKFWATLVIGIMIAGVVLKTMVFDPLIATTNSKHTPQNVGDERNTQLAPLMQKDTSYLSNKNGERIINTDSSLRKNANRRSIDSGSTTSKKK